MIDTLVTHHPSTLAPGLVQAYLETEYRVNGESGFTLQVGQASPELLIAHTRQQVVCSAFLTACNPLGRLLDMPDNGARQQMLAAELIHQGLAFLPGMGQHPSNDWPGEESFLVFGLSLEAAKTLGLQLQQNGFVWSGADAIPRLILLR